jgi:uncharacterized protein YmfQ (DUF2313 family)
MVIKSFRQLFPTGYFWQLKGRLGQLIDSISLSIQRVRDFLYQIVTESIPSTANFLQPWFEMLGIPYDQTLTLDQKRRIARQAYINGGGLARGIINEQVQIAFPNVQIVEISGYYPITSMAGFGQAGLMQANDYPSWLTSAPTDGSYAIHFYQVLGEVVDIQELLRLTGLLSRIAPAWMQAIFNVDILNQIPTAQAGLGQAGLMEAGRI